MDREHEETGNTFNTLPLKYEKHEKFGKHRRISEGNMKLENRSLNISSDLIYLRLRRAAVL
jgi:hypothetical protein